MPRGDFDVPERAANAPDVQDVEYWLGVYKSIEDVPSRYRLENFTSEFTGEDTWSRYLQTRDDLAESTKKNAWIPCGKRFKRFMDDVANRHHALATPGDIESYLSHIKDGGYSTKVVKRSNNTVYYQHLSPLKKFYSWLVTRPDYPHVYNPVLMAAHIDGVARELWYWQVNY